MAAALRTFAFVSLLCIALACACGTRALAITEYCPARLDPIQAMHPLDASGPATLFSYVLEGESSRSVAGSILVDTSAGWFKVSFPSTALTERVYDYQASYVKFSRRQYESVPLYVRFPLPVMMRTAFVGDAQSFGDAEFGWDAKGDVACGPSAGLEAKVPVPKADMRPLNPRIDLDTPPGAGATIASATSVPVPGSLSCAEPFTNATVSRAMAPDFPTAEMERGGSATVLVEVAINASGALDDAWLFVPSGSEWFDDAALRAARMSTYKAGTAFCQPASGMYIFRAEFRP
jgi:TonB family protein